MSKLYTILTEPENGWQRIDNTDNRITYSDDFVHDMQHNDCYNNTSSGSTSNNNKIEFYFYGTKLRIISDYRNGYRSDSINITIDNEEETYSQLGGIGWTFQTLTYEKTNLPLGKHHVTIHAEGLSGSCAFNFDAIDIDLDGTMLLPEEDLENSSTMSEVIKNLVKDTILNHELIKHCVRQEE